MGSWLRFDAAWKCDFCFFWNKRKLRQEWNRLQWWRCPAGLSVCVRTVSQAGLPATAISHGYLSLSSFLPLPCPLFSPFISSSLSSSIAHFHLSVVFDLFLLLLLCFCHRCNFTSFKTDSQTFRPVTSTASKQLVATHRTFVIIHFSVDCSGLVQFRMIPDFKKHNKTNGNLFVNQYRALISALVQDYCA